MVVIEQDEDTAYYLKYDYGDANPTWTTSSSIIWQTLGSDTLTTTGAGASFTQLNFGLVGVPAQGDFYVRLYEPFDPDTFGVSRTYYDEVHAVLFLDNSTYDDANAVYRDINIEVTETATTKEGRRGDTIHFNEFPEVAAWQYTGAGAGVKTEFNFNVTSSVDGDAITMTLDGTGRTYTYMASPAAPGNREWSTLAQLETEIFHDSNNYWTEVSGSTLTVVSAEFDKANLNPSISTTNGSVWSITNDTDKTDMPTEETFVSLAAPSSDASSPASTFDWDWNRNGESESDKLVHHAMKRQLRMLKTPAQRLQGPLQIHYDDTNRLSCNSALIGDVGENSYLFLSGEHNVAEAVYDIDAMKINDDSVSTSFNEKPWWQQP
jgi:hypothetical protein